MHLAEDASADPIRRLLADRAVRTVFQPIVDLDARHVVAFEALSRGPLGRWERPDVLFAGARDAGLLPELDRMCREMAVTTALAAGITGPFTVFVNVEPEILDERLLRPLVRQAAAGGLDVAFEITERSLGARPADLLATVRALRGAGMKVAIDDVGADDTSLAFMPLLQPDVVKLDLRLVQRRPSRSLARVMHAVNAYAEAHGAVILAEGIETEEQLAVALALGARLGQGYLFGAPAAAVDLPSRHRASAFRRSDVQAGPSPFACLPIGTPTRRSSKGLLLTMSRLLEDEAARLGSTAVVLSAFQRAEMFTPATARRYERLADQVGFVAALAADLPAQPAAGVHGVALEPGDQLCDEWDVVVIAPHMAAALLARDLGDVGPDAERRFDFALTYDRETVVAAAISLMSRVRGEGAAPPVSIDEDLAAVLALPLTAGGCDSLTGLPDRLGLLDRLAALLAAGRATGTALGLLVVDVDDFDGVNAEFGPDAGDAVLVELAERLGKACRPTDLIARIGADTFLMALTGLRAETAAVDARNAADALRTKIQEPVLTPDGVTVWVGVAVGVSVWPDDGDDVAALMRAAEQRMYAAKALQSRRRGW